jgi:hypothetical protein
MYTYRYAVQKLSWEHNLWLNITMFPMLWPTHIMKTTTVRWKTTVSPFKLYFDFQSSYKNSLIFILWNLLWCKKIKTDFSPLATASLKRQSSQMLVYKTACNKKIIIGNINTVHQKNNQSVTCVQIKYMWVICSGYNIHFSQFHPLQTAPFLMFHTWFGINTVHWSKLNIFSQQVTIVTTDEKILRFYCT